MPKPRCVDTSIPEGSIELGPSRTKKREERRRTQNALDELTELLASMPPKMLAALALDDDVRAEVLAYKKMPRGSARARQGRRIARLLRAEEPDVLLPRVRHVLAGGRVSDRRQG